MDKFPALLCFMSFVLLFTQKLRADGSSDTIRDNVFVGIGAIVETGSRVGEEQRVAMTLTHATIKVWFLHMRNSKGELLQAALAAKDLISMDQLRAILGLQTWEEVLLVTEIGTQSHVPIISLADATPKWATEQWSFLVQASPNQLKQIEAVAAMIQFWEWNQVTVIYENTDFSAFVVTSHLSKALKHVGAEIVRYVAFAPFASSSLSHQLDRVFVVHLSLAAARFSSEHPEESNHELSTFAVHAYDATWAVAQAMRKEKMGSQQILSRKTIGKSATLSSSMKDSAGKVYWPGGARKTPVGWSPTTSAYPLRMVGSIAILAKRYQHTEFTASYTESGLVMIVYCRARTRDKHWLFTKPFTNAMWVLIGATSLYNGSFSTLFSLNGNKLSSNLSRIATVMWLFMALVITWTYTANLANLLTLPQLEIAIQ
ncbi:hypothetical protein ACFX14_030753 [Malus domestica]